MIYAMFNTMPFDSRIDPFDSFVTTLCYEIIQVIEKENALRNVEYYAI